MNLSRKLVPLAVLAVLGLGGCGSDSNSTTGAAPTLTGAACATGAVSGAGSTFVQNLAQQWVTDYGRACSGATINYQGVGSGAGISQFTAGTIDFAGSDVPLKPEELAAAQAKYGAVLQIPWSAGGIAVEYKLSGVDNLKLSPATLAGLFAGTVTRWDDAAVKADNPGVTLPSVPVQVIHRSDGSGTTAAFTAYLTAVAPQVWKAGTGKDIAWPVGQGAKGSDQVTAAVKATEGAVGYAELSFAKGSGVSTASIRNAAGSFVGPDAPGGVSAALAEATVPANLNVALNYAPTSAQAYPISTVTYVILPAKPADAGKATLLRAFITYALGQGQNSAPALQYAPLPPALVEPAKAAAATISAG